MTRAQSRPVLDLDDDDVASAVPAQAVERNGAPPAPARMALPRPSHAVQPDDQPERYLISLCLSYSDTVIGQCAEAGITPTSFFDRDCGIVYRHMQDIWREHGEVDTALLAESLKLSGDFAKIGGWGGIGLLSGMVPTTINAPALIDAVRTGAMRRKLIEITARAASDAHTTRDPAESAAELLVRLQAVAEPGAAKPGLVARPFMSFAMPAKDDPSILLGNRFLCRGDGGILASTSGMGKSSLSLQAATTWALGRPLFGGLDPHGRALKSLIFQAEDSDGDMAEVKFSMIHAMQLTEAEQGQVAANVIIITDRIHRGLSFLTELRRQIAIHKPDIVWINPLLAFIGGDVNDAKAAGEFLREGLNSLNEPASFAYIVIHHTAKPPKERADRKWNEVMYEMAGSADLTNWARFVISLRASETEGRFNLVLAKRGVRAGYTKPSVTGNFNEPVTVLGLRHSKERMEVFGTDGVAQSLPVIHWEPCEAEAEAPKAPPAKPGRKQKYDFAVFRTAFPKLNEPPQTLNIIHRKVSDISAIPLTSFKDLCLRATAAGLLDRVETPIGFLFRLADHPPHGATAEA